MVLLVAFISQSFLEINFSFFLVSLLSHMFLKTSLKYTVGKIRYFR